MLMGGQTWKEIGDALVISNKTIESHSRNIRWLAGEGADKTTAPVALVVYALKYDLIPADSPLGEALTAWADRKG